MADLRFGVLGPLEVWRDGIRVDVPGRRRAVLAALLADAGRPVAADALVEAAWGGELPADPRAALRTVVSRLRTVLEEGTIRADPAGYTLDVPAVAIDAYRFGALLDRAEKTPPDAARLLDEALALCRGPAYAEFADREFARFDAQRLDLMRLEAIEARGAAALAAGEPRVAIARLAPLAAEHPFREHAVEMLMTALYDIGDHAEALASFRRHRARLADELGLDPSPALRELEARILSHELARPSRRSGAAVVPPAWVDTSTAFVGRDAAMAELVAAVEAARLVTVTGTGGVGKTRLVAQVLPALAERLGTPITVVALADVFGPSVHTAVAEALGLECTAEEALDGIVEHLRGSSRVLVLDECEHVRYEAAALAEAVLVACPSVRVLATSRHRLGRPPERLVPLDPLPTPGPGADPDRMELAASVRLLADRVRLLRPSFGVTGDNVRQVAGICRYLDGLPLALELAASRVAAFGVDPVLGEVAKLQDLGVLEQDGPVDLSTVIDWSYKLLTRDQRDLFALVSVFPADFDLEAVEGVAAAHPHWPEGRPVAEALAALAESSMLAAYPADRTVRYRMLTVVRAFAFSRVYESGSGRRARLAHLHWVCRWMERTAADCAGPDSVAAYARLRHRRADVVHALSRAVEEGETADAARLAAAVQLCLHWQPGSEAAGLMVELAERCAAAPGPESAPGTAAGACAAAHAGDTVRGRELAVAALAAAATHRERYLAHLAFGVAAMYLGDHDESARWWRAILNMDDVPPAYHASARTSLSLTACYRGDLPAARREAELAVLAAETAGAAAVHAFALYALGEAEAGARKTELLAAAAAKADLVGVAHVGQVARVAWLAALVRTGRHGEALELVAPLLDGTRRAGTWPQLWTTMRIFAELLAARGRPHEAVLLLAAADAADTAPPAAGADIARYAELTAALRDRLGGETMTAIAELARGVPPARLVERALAIPEDLASTAHRAYG